MMRTITTRFRDVLCTSKVIRYPLVAERVSVRHEDGSFTRYAIMRIGARTIAAVGTSNGYIRSLTLLFVRAAARRSA